MIQYGNTREPGIITDLTSSVAVENNGPAPNQIALIGQADLGNADNPADTGKVYEVTRGSTAVEWFGPTSSSLLTEGIVDALREGAMPVLAVAAEGTTVTGEDHSGTGTTTVSFDNAPIREDADSITVTLDSTEQTVNIVYDDVSTYSPADGECYVNPVDAKAEISVVPSTSLTFDYEHFDYGTALDVLIDNSGDVVDQIYPLAETASVVQDASTDVNAAQEEYHLSIMVGGASIYIDKSQTSSFTHSYDDSRTQLVYPTRFEDRSSALAAYAGLRADLGLEDTPINKKFDTDKRLMHSLNRSQRGDLIDENIVPLADEVNGARVADDPTTVTDNNTDEENMRYGFNRLAADYIIETTRRNQRPFIGRLNSQTIRNTLEGMVDDSLSELQQSNVVQSYNINILKEDSVTAGLEMDVNLIEPLRFIRNTVTISDGQ
jgi:hypothetical protein